MKFKPKKPTKTIAAKSTSQAKPQYEPEADKTPAPNIEDVKVLSPVRAKLENLVNRRKALDIKIKALEEQKKELSDAIMPILFRANVSKVVIDGYPTRIVESGHNQLSKSKLIEEGVDPATIEKCTEYVPHAPYIRIDPRKDED